ncbi:alpha/beta hydrolase [Actinoplanes sp. NPDC051851]|uniref:alpha/beta fold hydrolase n=1 Tax=Actinoplanes sp. NPDC051851 TaxID=3154753 RepID=UPI00342AF24C
MTFSHHRIPVGDLHLHATVGGDGPPLLLLGGWPQTSHAWRLLMPALAEEFTVVAADPRGVGTSDKPKTGYDTGTLAADMVELMRALGHDRFAMVGHDLGMWTGYALAVDHPDVLTRLALAEAVIPGLSASPPLFMPEAAVDRLFHFTFNRLDGLNERLIAGRERLFYGHLFATKAARPLEPSAVDHYIETLTDPEALRCSFEFYRALDATIDQNLRRRSHRITTPVLAIAGADSLGPQVAATLSPVTDDLTSVTIANCGHFPAEEAPSEMLAALLPFLR